MDIKALVSKIMPKKKQKPTIKTITKPQKPPKEETLQKNNQKPSEQKVIKQQEEPKPIKEYHETLYSKGHSPVEKKPSSSKNQSTVWKPKHWEGINTIEKNVDTIDKEKESKQTYSSPQETDIEKKVDLIIKKKQK